MLNKLWPIRAKHNCFGLNIGLDDGTLATFKGKDDDEAFTNVIQACFKRKTKLTWKDIIDVLRRPSLAEAALANKIAEEYCPSEIHGGKSKSYLRFTKCHNHKSFHLM